ncbi:MAG: fatty acid desaturase [Candidatus Omnitrophota bacterium]|jgi:fatty acid desaturase|nr:MAG: fatty acid desaturase [Candidatus Omnitrophota bacterium]
MKTKYYYKHIGAFRRELRNEISRPVLKELHQAVWWKHFAIELRQVFLAAAAVFLALRFDTLWIWLPCSIVIGFTVFGFTVLLHEVIHNAVFAKKRPRWNSFLGWMYALPSGISRTQFTRWHLDHHDELGHGLHDPKRAHLTPKILKRWYKFLYMTPALFPIYFRAAAKEAKTYPPAVQKQIRFERLITIALHVFIMAGLIGWIGGWGFLKVYAIPYFFIFPIAFTINRVGQHYNINPKDVAQWTTLMEGNWFWDFVFLYSNYHLEHHYFPAVPCYNLPQLHKLLQPLYIRHEMKAHSYGEVLYGWFILNQAPHTHWEM